MQILSLFLPKNTPIYGTRKIHRMGDADIFAPLLDLGGRIFPSTQLITAISDRSTPEDMITSTWRDGVFNGPLVVLINERSASASELVSGSLQETLVDGKPRALILGTPSFGKGTAQSGEVWPHDSKVIFMKTRFFFTTPKGRTPHMNPIQPDLFVGVNPTVTESSHVALREEQIYDWNLTFPGGEEVRSTSRLGEDLSKCIDKNSKAKRRYKEAKERFLPTPDYQFETAVDAVMCL
jgi:carboxyl-terminal processing protease